MRAIIDKAGRLVIPKPLRDRLGLGPGEVEVTVDGTGLRVEALVEEGVENDRGRLVIPAAGESVSADRRAIEADRAQGVDVHLLPSGAQNQPTPASGTARLEKRHGRLVAVANTPVTDDDVQALVAADRR